MGSSKITHYYILLVFLHFCLFLANLDTDLRLKSLRMLMAIRNIPIVRIFRLPIWQIFLLFHFFDLVQLTHSFRFRMLLKMKKPGTHSQSIQNANSLKTN